MINFRRQACYWLGMLCIIVSAGEAWTATAAGGDGISWTPAQVGLLRSLWLGSLPPPPADPGNAVADHPQAAELGRRLFFDRRLSGNGQVACATCHRPAQHFTDRLARSRGVGVTDRRSMSLIGAAYSPWLFWDGRKDSLWSQALGPLESPVEHGGTRTGLVRLVLHADYRDDYRALFGAPADFHDVKRFPPAASPLGDVSGRAAWRAMTAINRDAVNRAFVNIGKSIAAYQRQLRPAPTPFDDYVAALLAGDRAAQRAALTDAQFDGLKLFIGKAQCVNCHNGPLFTNNDFHNTGVPAVAGALADPGRLRGSAEALVDPFNCFSAYSDAGQGRDCAELRFMRSGPGLAGAFKTPSLRGAAARPPYMHAGQFADLGAVLEHYDRAPGAPLGRSELRPLRLSAAEKTRLIAFLHALRPTATEPAAD